MRPKFSLVMSTINRTQQLVRFLEHLDRQTYREFELIIVDQNDDDRLRPIISDYKHSFCIIHTHSEKGASHGRNRGMEKISGELVAFPDDDCWYAENLLERVCELFAVQTEVDIITGRTIDSGGRSSLGKFDMRAGNITQRNVFKRGNTNTVFIRRAVAERISFDESLGVGAGTKWGSGEDPDYLLQALAAGFKLYYYPDLTVYHEEPVIEYNEAAINRGYSYALGMGRVFKKHRYPLDFVFVKQFYQEGGMIVALDRKEMQRVKYHRAVFKGRWERWISPWEQ